jgi:hypothetical protein
MTPRPIATGRRHGLLLGILVVASLACVPTPGRASSSPEGSAGLVSPAPTATPEPTPWSPTPIPSFIRPTPTPLPTFLAYTVQPGDTLLSIGRAHGTSGRSIAFWNRETYPSLDPDSPDYSPNRIEAGWVLLLVPGIEVDPEDFD